MNCDAPQSITFTCAQLYPAYTSAPYSMTGSGITYTRRINYSGWADATALTPNDPTISSWTRSGPPNCTVTQTRAQTCSANGTGGDGGAADGTAGPSGAMSGNDGGGGGGSKVLCTYFYKKGLLPHDIYTADSEYARLYISEKTKNGYHKWAVPMVQWLQEKDHPIAEKLIFFWVNSWAHQMAYDMNVIQKRSYVGTAMKIIGEPICNLIGNFVDKTNYQSLWKNAI